MICHIINVVFQNILRIFSMEEVPEVDLIYVMLEGSGLFGSCGCGGKMLP